MRNIRKGLYIGDIGDAVSVFRGQSGNRFTHVLSMVTMPDSFLEYTGAVKRKVVPLADVVDENLLLHLEECLDFIKEAMNSDGAVLVHCYQGLSRSVSVVAAYLMVAEGLSVNQALTEIKHHSVNKGFVRQLHLFKKMGHVVKKEDPGYKEVEAAFNDRVLPLRVVTPAMLKNDFKVIEEDEDGWAMID